MLFYPCIRVYAGIAIKSAPKKLNLTFDICVVQSSKVVIQNDR